MEIYQDNVLLSVLLFTTSIFVYKSFVVSSDNDKCAKERNLNYELKLSNFKLTQDLKRLSEMQLNTSSGYHIQPIGHINSCYKQCIGTPRQGLLVPSSRSSIVLIKQMSPECLDGLEEFSHIWILFRFHLNNNFKEIKSMISSANSKSSDKLGTSNLPQHQENMSMKDNIANIDVNQKKGNRGRQSNPNGYTFNAKITPPMLKEKKGVLATRSPHRPNPIGITLARVERVDKAGRTIVLSACDLVHDTPVYDIKPYVPMYDSVQVQSGDKVTLRVPGWIEETITTRNRVYWLSEDTDQNNNSLMKLVTEKQHKLKHYKNNAPLYMQAVMETLSVDVRSKYQTKKATGSVGVKRSNINGVNKISVSAAPTADDTNSRATTIPFDNTCVTYTWDALSDIITVTDIHF